MTLGADSTAFCSKNNLSAIPVWVYLHAEEFSASLKLLFQSFQNKLQAVLQLQA